MNEPHSTKLPLPGSGTRRFLALWFPFLPVERLTCAAADEPFVLVEKQKGALRVTACNAAAYDASLRPGLTLAEARARIPALAAADADCPADRRLLLALAEACGRFSPLVALDGGDGVLIDITGCAHLFGGEDAMRARVLEFFDPPSPARERKKMKALTARACIAGTPEAAHVLARCAGVSIAPPGGEAGAVSSLPVAALDAPEETARALVRAGLKTIGDLARRPGAVLAARFGAGLTTKLARVLGHEVMPLTPLREPPEIAAERLFPEPLLDAGLLTATLAELTREVCAELSRRGQGARRFEASVFRSDGTARRIAIDMARASRSAAAILRLFALRLDTLADPLDPGFGFDALRLAVLRCEPLSETQASLDGKQNNETALAELVDRLVTRFGRDRVLRFVTRDTHDPARAAAAVALAAPALSVPRPADELPRPLHIFHPPQPIEAMAEVPDAPPIRFRWRKVLHEVVASEGPERIAPEWWLAVPAAAARDYYRVEDKNGGRFWLFREGLFGESPPPRWYVHGLFP